MNVAMATIQDRDQFYFPTLMWSTMQLRRSARCTISRHRSLICCFSPDGHLPCPALWRSKGGRLRRRSISALGAMLSTMSRPTVATIIAVVCAVSYPFLLLFVLGRTFSPLNPDSSWGLAAEHGELQPEHWSHFAVAIYAACPLAVASMFFPVKVARLLLLTSALSAALPYAVQQSHQFQSNDSWLANYTWQLGAIEVAMAPLVLAGVLAGIAWLWRRVQ